MASSYPNSTGIGTYNQNLENLGIYRAAFYFHFDPKRVERTTSPPGYRTVKSNKLPGKVAYPLSFLLQGDWDKAVGSFDYVHVTSPEFFHLAKRRRGVIGTVHDLYTVDPGTRHEYSLAYRYLVRKDLGYVSRLDGLIAISRNTQKMLETLLPGASATVIHNWTSNDFRPRDKKGARAALNLPPDKVIALNVGSCALNKNLQLLQAISRALSDEVLTVQIGGGSAAASRPSGYHQVVEQVPPQTLPLYYNAADLYVATSTAEGFCFPVIEAVNSGLPVIASPIDTFSETLRGSPYIVRSFELADWIEAILHLTEPAHHLRAVNWYKENLGNYYREERGRADMIRFLSGLGLGPYY